MEKIGQCLYFVVGLGLIGLMHPVVVVDCTVVAAGVCIVDHTAGNVVAAAAHERKSVAAVCGTALADGWIGAPHTVVEHLLKQWWG